MTESYRGKKRVNDEGKKEVFCGDGYLWLRERKMNRGRWRKEAHGVIWRTPIFFFFFNASRCCCCVENDM